MVLLDAEPEAPSGHTNTGRVVAFDKEEAGV